MNVNLSQPDLRILRCGIGIGQPVWVFWTFGKTFSSTADGMQASTETRQGPWKQSSGLQWSSDVICA